MPPWSFNREEVKDHGDSVNVIDAPLTWKHVRVVHDVTTAGITIKDTGDEGDEGDTKRDWSDIGGDIWLR